MFRLSLLHPTTQFIRAQTEQSSAHLVEPDHTLTPQRITWQSLQILSFSHRIRETSIKLDAESTDAAIGHGIELRAAFEDCQSTVQETVADSVLDFEG